MVEKSGPWERAAFAVVILGALLRVIGLGRQSMWYDELYSVLISKNGFADLWGEAAADTTPPLYYVAQSVVIRAFGLSEITMRILPALAGVVTIWLVFAVGKRLFDAKTGFWAAALFATAVLPLRYAQEARAYSFLMMFAALALLALLRLAETPSRFRAIQFGLALSALAYTHVYGVLGAVGIVVGMLSVRSIRVRVRSLGLLAAAGAGLSFIPWGLVILNGQFQTIGHWAEAGSWAIKPPGNLFTEFWIAVGRYAPWPDGPSVTQAFAFAGVVLVGLAVPPPEPAIAMTGEGVKASSDRVHTPGDARLLLVLAAVVPMVIGLLISEYVLPIHNLRNGLVVVPAFYLLAAAGGLRLRRFAGYALVALLLVSAAIGLNGFYSSTSKGHWREAAAYLIDEGAQSQGVIVSSNMVPLDVNMYSIVLGHEEQFPLAELDWTQSGSELDRSIRGALEGKDSVYVVTAFIPLTGEDRTAFDDSMRRMQGWRLEETRNYETVPLVRHWVRTD